MKTFKVELTKTVVVEVDAETEHQALVMAEEKANQNNEGFEIKTIWLAEHEDNYQSQEMEETC